MREKDLKSKIVFDAQGLRIGSILSVKLKEGAADEVLAATLRLDRWLLSQWPELTTDSISLDPSRVAVVEAHTVKLSISHGELRPSLGPSVDGPSGSGH